MATRPGAVAGRKIAKKVAARKSAPRKTPTKAAAPAPIVVTAGESVTLIVEQPKQKLVRDSFTMPKGEYDVIATLKSRLVRLDRPTKKGELIRAGIAALAAMSDAALRVSVERVPSLKTGRPKKSKSDPSRLSRKSGA